MTNNRWRLEELLKNEIIISNYSLVYRPDIQSNIDYMFDKLNYRIIYFCNAG